MAMRIERVLPVALAFGMSTLNVRAENALRIPPTVGTIIQTHLNAETAIPDYVLIQDVHGHGEAQLHIATLLQLLRKHWGVRQAFIEGAFTRVEKHDLPAAYLDEKTRISLAAQGELSGPELAMLESQDAFDLIGIDDPTLYRETLQIYAQLQTTHEALAREGRAFTTQESALLSLHMTPADYERWQSQNGESTGSPLRKNAIRMAETFYALTDQRSMIFLSKAAATSEAGPRVLVTGGFHMRKMCAALEQEGKSFIVLRPTITRGGFAGVYTRHLEQTARVLQTPALIASDILLKHDSTAAERL